MGPAVLVSWLLGYNVSFRLSPKYLLGLIVFLYNLVLLEVEEVVSKEPPAEQGLKKSASF